MAWKGRKKDPVEFANLLGPLLNSRLQQTNNALYQVLAEIIKRSGQNKDLIFENINEIVGQITAIGDTIIVVDNLLKDSTFLTADNEAIELPNSRQLIAGSGVTFDDTIANQRTVNVIAGSGSWIPMVTGAEPLEIMSDGAGNLLLILYTP
jgi:hypothetical protein